MREHGWALGLALLALAGSASVARGGDGFVWDPNAPVAVTPGSRRFVEEQTSVKHDVKVRIAGRPRESRDTQASIDVRYADEVAAVEGGRVTRRRLAIERYVVTGGGPGPDRCLEGRVIWIDVAANGGQSAWIEDEDARITIDAKRWVLDRFQTSSVSGLKDESFVDALKPPRPAKEGDEWQVDPVELSQLLLGGAAVDEKASSVKGKLARVTVDKSGAHVGHVDFKASVKLRFVPGLQLSWKSGGVFSLDVKVDLSLEPAKLRFTKATVAGALAGKAEEVGQGWFGLIDVASSVSSIESEGPLPSVAPRAATEGRRPAAPKAPAAPSAVAPEPPSPVATAPRRASEPPPSTRPPRPVATGAPAPPWAPPPRAGGPRVAVRTSYLGLRFEAPLGFEWRPNAVQEKWTDTYTCQSLATGQTFVVYAFIPRKELVADEAFAGQLAEQILKPLAGGARVRCDEVTPSRSPLPGSSFRVVATAGDATARGYVVRSRLHVHLVLEYPAAATEPAALAEIASSMQVGETNVLIMAALPLLGLGAILYVIGGLLLMELVKQRVGCIAWLAVLIFGPPAALLLAHRHWNELKDGVRVQLAGVVLVVLSFLAGSAATSYTPQEPAPAVSKR